MAFLAQDLAKLFGCGHIISAQDPVRGRPRPLCQPSNHAAVLSQKPDLICIVETWLCEDVSDNELSLPDYQLYRLDRNRHGGGIMLYAHSSLSCKVLLQGGPFNLEFLVLSVSAASVSHKFCICLFYRPRHHQFLFLIIFVSHCR